MGSPRLRRVIEVEQPRALVVLVHGGLERSKLPVHDTNASLGWPHMKFLQDRMSLRLAARGVEVWALIHRYAGWNSDSEPSPVPDLRWALAEAHRLHPGVPVILVGHSMGARTCLRVAADPSVIGLIGLCPWYPADEVAPVGVPLRVAYADWDWECPYSSIRPFLDRASATTDVRVTNLGRDVHYMLRTRRWAAYILGAVEDLVEPALRVG